MEKPSNVCAVVVTRNIGPSITAQLDALLGQTGFIVIVDNCSQEETLHLLESWSAAHADRCRLIHHATNNLAMAQNAGIRLAMQQGYDWVLLMDHDSRPEADMVAAMLACLDRYPAPGSVGILAPYLRDVNSCRGPKYLRGWGRSPVFRRTGFGSHAYLDDILCVIASGSLVRREVFERIGLMDDQLCIDDIDRDFCLRAVKSGHRILGVRDAVLHHRLGVCRDHYMLGMRVTTTNHAAERRYYIYRNRLRNWRRHGMAVPAFVAFDALAILYDLGRILLLEQDKRRKLRAALTGMNDALRGVKGANPSFLPGEPAHANG